MSWAVYILRRECEKIMYMAHGTTKDGGVRWVDSLDSAMFLGSWKSIRAAYIRAQADDLARQLDRKLPTESDRPIPFEIDNRLETTVSLGLHQLWTRRFWGAHLNGKYAAIDRETRCCTHWFDVPYYANDIPHALMAQPDRVNVYGWFRMELWPGLWEKVEAAYRSRDGEFPAMLDLK